MWIIKISHDYLNIETTLRPQSLNFTSSLNNIGLLSFSVLIQDQSMEFLDRMKKVELIFAEDGKDKSIWTGVINNMIWVAGNQVRIECVDEKGHLNNNRKTLIERDYTWEHLDDLGLPRKTFKFVLDELIPRLSQRENGLKGEFEYEVVDFNIEETEIDIYIDPTLSFKAILDTIGEKMGKEWLVYKNKIVFVDTVGVDRTLINNDYVEIKYDINTPSENNCILSSADLYGSDLATRGIIKGSKDFSTFEGDTSYFGSVEKDIFVPGGSTSQSMADKELEKRGENNALYSLRPDPGKFQFDSFDVGDKIKLFVGLLNDKFNFDGEMRILEKNVNVHIGRATTIDITMSDNIDKLKYKSTNYFKLIDDRVKILQASINN